MSNLGFQIIYQQINKRSDTACERLFLPDSKTKQEYIRTNTPLLTLETQRPLYEFGMIGFDVTFEMDYFNLIEILQLGKVKVFAAERSENDPIIIIGGPCATFNPEPLADFIDVCIIGEGEKVIHELLDSYQEGRCQGLSRKEILFNLAQIEGLYVPCFYQHVYHEDGSLSKIEKKIYNSSMKNSDLNILSIDEKLEDSTELGAMFCEFEYFKFLFNIQKRKSLRNDEHDYYGIMTLNNLGNIFQSKNDSNNWSDLIKIIQVFSYSVFYYFSSFILYIM
jgi:radical SAM superfamily enzyme YgiQ (UPF0313 family)